MSLIPLSTIGATPLERLMGHMPTILDNWSALEVAFFQNSTFDKDFLEQIRRALAFDNLCQYCMAKAGPADSNPATIRLAEALRLANKIAINHRDIEEVDITHLKQYFSDKELVELISFCCFISASQRFGAILKLQAAETYV